MSPVRRYRDFISGVAFWAALFAAGVLAGAAFPGVFHRFVAETVRVAEAIAGGGGTGSSAPPPLLFAAGIFAKNFIVAAFLMLAGRRSRGVFPAAVCFLNGVIVGSVGVTLCHSLGISPWRFAAALAPHGAVELPAVFLAAAIGMAPLAVKEKVRLAWLPAAMLAAAAVLETWVSPLVAARVLPAI